MEDFIVQRNLEIESEIKSR